jgi:hypothetical protein
MPVLLVEEKRNKRMTNKAFFVVQQRFVEKDCRECPRNFESSVGYSFAFFKIIQ